MWTVEPEQIWKRPRRPGISGYMRLKNEAEFLERAIETHLSSLDELVIVHNDCSDETPEICNRWARRFPDKIQVFEYEPSVVPLATIESVGTDPRSPHSMANYSNFALSRTNCRIVIRIDGDHHAVATRFARICDRVRRHLAATERYPIYGLNLAIDQGEIVIYNFYDYHPEFGGERLAKRGPPPFTSGDQAFHHVDASSWYTIEPVEGLEWMDPRHMRRYASCPMTYCFFHLKGLKADRGTGNWGFAGREAEHLRRDWIVNVNAQSPAHVSALEAMRRHNPMYFRGASLYRELREAFPGISVRMPHGEAMPAVGLRNRLADLWYRVAYP